MNRSSGILLPINSLPGGHGIGDLGPSSFRWIDHLKAGGQKYWQILPTGPTGFGNSPYSSCSAFAGNFMLISLESLTEMGLLSADQIAEWTDNHPHWINYERVRQFKHQHLKKAYENFKNRSDFRDAYEQFCGNNPWLDKFVSYLSPKDDSDPHFLRFTQFIFAVQIQSLKAYANKNGIQLIGDLPMYIADDSADRYDHPELFELDSGFVAGAAPAPAYPQGQRWGNPLFRWDAHRANGFRWWLDRVRVQLRQVDVLRLDYFNGYVAYWACGAHGGNAGHWRRGPGAELFEAARREFGNLPFIAEDLGQLTEEIHRLRNKFTIPSMKVLQYAFDCNPKNPYLPENIGENCVVYSATHDTDTSLGWWKSLPHHSREQCMRAIKADGRDISWDMIKLASYSRAKLAVLLYQDVLCLGRDARINTPGSVSSGNWSFRIQPQHITPKIAESMAWMAKASGRA